jgi:threonine synthase
MSRKTPTLNPRLLGFKCIRCNTLHAVGDYAEGCPLCSKAGYPISVAPAYSSLPPLTANTGGYGMQVFADRLPYSAFRSLGEGNTPVAPLDQATAALGLQSVTLKLESSNPTGSHKDRMTAQFVARAVAKQAPVVAAASSGNAGASLAAYAAASKPEMRHRHHAEDQPRLAARDRNGRRGVALCRKSARALELHPHQDP